MRPQHTTSENDNAFESCYFIYADVCTVYEFDYVFYALLTHALMQIRILHHPHLWQAAAVVATSHMTSIEASRSG